MRIAHNSKLNIQNSTFKLVSAEDVARVDFVFNVLQAIVKAVGDDGFALRLEVGEVVHYFAAEEGGAVLQCWLVDDNLGTLCLDALHDALDG